MKKKGLAMVLALVCWVMTQFVHNQVVATVFMPILYSFSLSQNVNPAAATALLGFAAATVILAPLIPDPDPDYYHSDYVSPTAADADDDKIFDKIHNSRMRYLELPSVQ